MVCNAGSRLENRKIKHLLEEAGWKASGAIAFILMEHEEGIPEDERRRREDLAGLCIREGKDLPEFISVIQVEVK